MKDNELKTDSLQNDSAEAKKKEVVDAPVQYESKDSMVWTKGGNAYLYGSGKVNYQNIELTAERITVNIPKSEVYAEGVKDSTGTETGRPVFKEGSTPYESETMSYNFKTKKGFIRNVITEQGDGYMIGRDAKKGAEGEFFIQNGKYTTCEDHEAPHFYLNMTRGKVRPEHDVVFGPAYLVVCDVPLPLAVPFGFFPFTQEFSSGFIMPSYGDELERGFYLKDGGYYFAFSDYLDLKVTGEIFTKGSWGITGATNYRRRYKYSGNVNVNYLVTKTGEKNMPDYSVSKNFKVVWSHRQDAKANPNSNFSASVNYATTNYERKNLSSVYNPALNSQSQRTSSVSYSRSIPDWKMNISTSMNIAQNMRDSTLALTLPSLNVSLSRIYPFKRKKAAGNERWYEKIALTYSGALSNSVTAKEDQILHTSLTRDWRNGMKHSIPISASFTAFKYINITPSFNYTSRWYTYRIDQRWDDDSHRAVRDTIYGFNRVYNYNLSVSANTKLYGFYQPLPFLGDKVKMIRHVFTPSVSYSMAPDFSDSRYGFWKSYTYTDDKGEVHTVDYSPYAGALYGTVSKGRSGTVSVDVSNNVEMKVKSDKDSTGVRKISIFDELGASMSYNMAATTRPWSNLTTRLRMKLTKNYTFSLNTTWPSYGYVYKYDDTGRRTISGDDRPFWETDAARGFHWPHFPGMSQNLSYTFNNQTWSKIKDRINTLLHGKDEDEDNEGDGDGEGDGKLKGGTAPDRRVARSSSGSSSEKAEVDEDGYMPFSLPWSLSLSYGVTLRENIAADYFHERADGTGWYGYKITQNLNISGNMKLSNKWNMNFSSGWDFIDHEFTTTTMNISRDLHCFSMSCGVVLSPYMSYNFSFRANSSMLADALKYDQRSSASRNASWY
ncbi:MAG: LPS-assembly protein LptD [Bacteroidaceae bacterium]|nr:LPS-assembly protein LptD [Bacteroidaceae bacterium]